MNFKRKKEHVVVDSELNQEGGNLGFRHFLFQDLRVFLFNIKALDELIIQLALQHDT